MFRLRALARMWYSFDMSTTYFHVTPRRNVPSILDRGIRLEFVRGRINGIWMCDAARLPWAVQHISRWQRCRPEDLSILELDMKGATLRHIREGVKVYHDHVPGEWIKDVNFYAVGEPQ